MADLFKKDNRTEIICSNFKPIIIEKNKLYILSKDKLIFNLEHGFEFEIIDYHQYDKIPNKIKKYEDQLTPLFDKLFIIKPFNAFKRRSEMKDPFLVGMLEDKMYFITAWDLDAWNGYKEELNECKYLEIKNI